MEFQSDPRWVWLYIEDSQWDAKLVSTVVTEQCPDVRLITVSSSAQALEFLSSQHVDLILLDPSIHPWFDSEAVQKLRAVPGHSNTPIVVFSGYTGPSIVQSFYEAGALGYVFKPTELDELFAVIKSMVDFWCAVLAHDAAIGITRPQNFFSDQNIS